MRAILIVIRAACVGSRGAWCTDGRPLPLDPPRSIRKKYCTNAYYYAHTDTTQNRKGLPLGTNSTHVWVAPPICNNDQ